MRDVSNWISSSDGFLKLAAEPEGCRDLPADRDGLRLDFEFEGVLNLDWGFDGFLRLPGDRDSVRAALNPGLGRTRHA